ncbi:MAG: Methylthioribose-1-phosphate isomerase [Promethearchaeota archaeon]|nr:MAG: Methylthioribose-1-phosphate isomerase [Candidatus Lokiarchaeota archaeon]
MRITMKDGTKKEIMTVWREADVVKMIDQRPLPFELKFVDLNTTEEIWHSIKDMYTRGAGAIGVTAGFGMAQVALQNADLPPDQLIAKLEEAKKYLDTARPTAVNLMHATKRTLEKGKDAQQRGDDSDGIVKAVVEEADEIFEEDQRAATKMAEYGGKLIQDGWSVLTHCNAGALAFSGLWGTATGPVRWAHQQGKNVFVFCDETRPRCQGARLTAWEMAQEGIDYAIIVDNANSHFIQRGKVDIVFVGSDRIAANGDVCNKIGTLGVALACKHYNVPFYVVAPRMTIDYEMENGMAIEIEERDQEEVTCMWGLDYEKEEKVKMRIAEINANAKNIAFDVTPAELVSGIITEFGILEPSKEGLAKIKDLPPV